MRIQKNSIIHQITLYRPSGVDSRDLQDDIANSSIRLKNGVVHDVESDETAHAIEYAVRTALSTVTVLTDAFHLPFDTRRCIPTLLIEHIDLPALQLGRKRIVLRLQLLECRRYGIRCLPELGCA